MNYMDLKSELETTGLPVAYGEFKDTQSPPFIIIQSRGNDDLQADNSNYAKIDDLAVELYSDIKYPPTEQEVEQILTDSGLSYNKRETLIKEESMYQIVYELQLI